MEREREKYSKVSEGLVALVEAMGAKKPGKALVAAMSSASCVVEELDVSGSGLSCGVL